MENKFDTIVVGLGATGSAAVYQLAKRGNKVLGIDRFSPPHASGSSHGDTRIIRQAIGEGEEYVPLVFRSYELWREIEQATGRDLLTITGGLTLENRNSEGVLHGRPDFLRPGDPLCGEIRHPPPNPRNRRHTQTLSAVRRNR
jgi:sarcosine oxidase